MSSCFVPLDCNFVWPVEKRPTFEIVQSSKKARSLFRIWHSGALPIDVHVYSYRPLARMHLARDWRQAAEIHVGVVADAGHGKGGTCCKWDSNDSK